MVPANFAAAVIDALGMTDAPPADAYLGEVPKWIPRDELPPPPSVEELRKDPDVAAVLEAAGKGACLLALARD